MNGNEHATSDPGGIKAKLEAAVAELYEDAGLPVPIILDLPVPIILERPGLHDYTHVGGITVRREGQRVAVSLPAREEALEPSMAHALGTYLAAYADSIESEPDPAEVEELTRVLCGFTPGMALPGADYRTEVARQYAGAALRWMRDREAAP